MAEPGDPKGPQGGDDHDHDHDAEVGFCTPESLAGRPVEPPAPEPEPTPQSEPEPAPEPEVTPDLFDPPEPASLLPEPEPVETKAAPGPFDRTVAAAPGLEARFAADRERLAGSSAAVAPAPTFGRAAPPQPLPMGLYAVYVLILLAVPTLGVSVLVALLAVTRREPPEEPLAASHFVYQQRTLWASVIAAALGAILVIVNVGVFVLFVLAVWVLARGAYGVLKLKAGRPVPNPRAWLF